MPETLVNEDWSKWYPYFFRQVFSPLFMRDIFVDANLSFRQLYYLHHNNLHYEIGVETTIR